MERFRLKKANQNTRLRNRRCQFTTVTPGRKGCVEGWHRLTPTFPAAVKNGPDKKFSPLLPKFESPAF